MDKYPFDLPEHSESEKTAKNILSNAHRLHIYSDDIDALTEVPPEFRPVMVSERPDTIFNKIANFFKKLFVKK